MIHNASPGESVWLLQWDCARLVTLDDRSKVMPSVWNSHDENGNKFPAHEVSFYRDAVEVWEIALENARDSVMIAEMRLNEAKGKIRP